MYLSCLLINVGNDPDKPRPGRLWLRNVYRVHQRLCMAFPTPAKKKDDDPFLQPFDLGDFDGGIVKDRKKIGNEENRTRHGFLFRIEHTNAPTILVQSSEPPDWKYAFQNAGFLLNAPPQVLCPEKCETFIQAILTDGRAQFRLRANPTVKRRVGREDNAFLGKNGKRFVLTDKTEQREWLRKRENLNEKELFAGFEVSRCEITQEGSVVGWKPNRGDREDHRISYRSVRFEGELTVTDRAKFREALASGIGSGKAFGFGLLSLARVPALK